MADINFLQKNTKVLGKLLISNEIQMPGAQKIEIILQLFDNLKILKEEMSEDEYNEHFAEIDQAVRNYFDKITEPTFVNNILEKIDVVLKK